MSPTTLDPHNFSRLGRAAFALLKRHNLVAAMPYWVAAVLTGLVAVGYAQAIEYVTRTAEYLLTHYPQFILIISPCCFVVARLLVEKIAPYAVGSGIPQVMAAIEIDRGERDRHLKDLFGKRVFFTKISSSLICILGGGAIGREGPMTQISECIFQSVSHAMRRIVPNINPHAWLLAGGASGIAAAFNTPLGGIVFALEELTSPHFFKVKTALITAVIISGTVAQAILGSYLYIGQPHIDQPHLMTMVFALAAGILGGVAGGAFGKTLIVGSARLRRFTSNQRLLFAAFAGLCVATLALALGPRVMGGGVELIRDLLFGREPPQYGAMLLGRFTATSMSFLSGVAGGVFAPALAIGASLGANLEMIFQTGNVGLMVILGMTAFLAAFTHAPFTAFVLVFEMTGQHLALFPMMLSAMSAVVTSRLVCECSFYHVQSELLLEQMGLRPNPPSADEPPPAKVVAEA